MLAVANNKRPDSRTQAEHMHQLVSNMTACARGLDPKFCSPRFLVAGGGVGGEEWVEIPDKTSLLKMTELYVAMHKFVVGVCCCHARFFDKSDSLLSGFKLCPMLIKEMRWQTDFVGFLSQLIADMPASVCAKSWLFSLDRAKLWIDGALKVSESLRLHCFLKLADLVAAFSQRLTDAAPKVDHFINDCLYIRSQAKKKLIEWPERSFYCSQSVELYHAISGLSEAHANLKLRGTVDELIGDQKAPMTAAFEESKKWSWCALMSQPCKASVERSRWNAARRFWQTRRLRAWPRRCGGLLTQL